MNRIRIRTWPILVLGFGTLMGLIAFMSVAALRKANELHTNLARLNSRSSQAERALQAIRSDIHISSLILRDYLLDTSLSEGREYREELLERKASMQAQLDQLQALYGGRLEGRLGLLRGEVRQYWDSMNPIFDWEDSEKLARSLWFLRKSVMPRREAVLKLAEEIEKFTEDNRRRQEAQVVQSERDFDRFLQNMTIAALALGALVALGAVWRVGALERRSAREQERAEQAERELRRLSQELVRAQEEERRSISRELHDEVGQMLTGLRMELSNLQKSHHLPKEQFDRRIDEGRILLEQTLRAVRDLAMGLRPSMLDDLGLAPALEWQAREFSRRYDIPVSVAIQADLEQLADAQRTSIYRVVQEALTNCARHAKARAVEIAVTEQDDRLVLTIEDDGQGMANRSRQGLGLLGMQERVRELGGTLLVAAGQNQRGTRLRVEVPLEPAGKAAYV